MAIVFDCDWEDGSDILNTGGTHVWDSETDSAGLISEASDSLMWNTDYLLWDGQSSAVAYLEEDIVDIGSLGFRIGLHVVSHSLADTNLQYLCTFGGIGLYIYLYNNSGQLEVRMTVWNASTQNILIGSVAISTGTNYQVIVKVNKNTLNGAVFEVWDEAGTTQIGSTQTYADTVKNADATYIKLGSTASVWKTSKHGWDIVQLINTYDFPDKKTAAGGLSIPIAMHHYLHNLGK